MANSTMPKAKPAFDLEIELVLVENNAKRSIRVGANITFERLHKIIQAAYNWKEAHLYQFLLFKNGAEGERPSVEIVHNKEEAINPKAARFVTPTMSDCSFSVNLRIIIPCKGQLLRAV